MALDKAKAKEVAREIHTLLVQRGLKLEEVTMALMYMMAWDLTQHLGDHDLHRVAGHLWEYSKVLDFHVDEELGERFAKWRERRKR